ncbi:MAG: hypothetical protein HY909_20490 [Deltaproteobacteria bacterium]|nr:hypothetical protein [Deltaproteobacteria bacterium]
MRPFDPGQTLALRPVELTVTPSGDPREVGMLVRAGGVSVWNQVDTTLDEPVVQGAPLPRRRPTACCARKEGAEPTPMDRPLRLPWILAWTLAACGEAPPMATTPDAARDGSPDTASDAPTPQDTGTLADSDLPDTTDSDAPPPPPPPGACLSLVGAEALLPAFGRGTAPHTAISMAPDPALGGVVLEAHAHPGSWTDQRAIPRGAHDSDGAYHDGWFYLLGGQNNGIPMNEVAEFSMYASRMEADGSLGPWREATPFMIPMRDPGMPYLGITDHIITLHANVAYLTGGAGALGMDRFRQMTRVVFATPRDGEIPWRMGPENPQRRFGHDAVVASGFLYTLAGEDGIGGTDDVSFAPILPSGNLGAWRRTTPVPDGNLIFLSGAASARRIYAMGGCRRNNCLSTANIERRIFAADLGDDGALGPWRAAGELPGRTFDMKSFISNGRLFVFGGRPGGFSRCGDTGGDNYRDVWWADLLADGSLGPWQGGAAMGSALPRPRSDFWIRRDDRDHLWIFGGRTSCIAGEGSQNQNFPRSVWRAALERDPGRAHQGSWLSGPLSPMAGTASAVRVTATGGAVTTRIRVALRATPDVWGPWREPGAMAEVPVPDGAAAVQVLVEATGDGMSTPVILRVDVLCR